VRSPWLFVLFIAFFAHMIAGPILRARELVPQLARGVRDRFRRTRLHSYGLSLCLAGLTKKVIFADALAEPVAALFSQTPSDIAMAWLGAWLFAFQIYFDFSGYSDIAVGTAYLLGIHLPANFRTPYLSRDPQEFWRRWHITLSTWIRDYLYIPLGGSRAGGPFRQTMVLVAVMALAGLWHGAGWQFVLWGLAWGLYLALWRWARAIFTMFGPVRWLFHMAVVTVLWVLFRSPDLTQALDYLAVMFGMGPNGWALPSLAASNAWWVMLGSALLLALHWGEHAVSSRRMLWKLRAIDGPILWGFLASLSIFVLMMPRLLDSPFIYFRF
jgi:alginate O-acetyltransferase complex protein AlgI